MLLLTLNHIAALLYGSRREQKETSHCLLFNLLPLYTDSTVLTDNIPPDFKHLLFKKKLNQQEFLTVYLKNYFIADPSEYKNNPHFRQKLSNLFRGSIAYTKDLSQDFIKRLTSQGKGVSNLNDIIINVKNYLRFWDINPNYYDIIYDFITEASQNEVCSGQNTANNNLRIIPESVLSEVLSYILSNLESSKKNRDDYLPVVLVWLILIACLREYIAELAFCYKNSEQIIQPHFTPNSKDVTASLNAKLYSIQTSIFSPTLNQVPDQQLFPTGRVRTPLQEDDFESLPIISLSQFLQQTWEHTLQQHIYIEGIGGIGKTVALLSFVSDYNINTKHIPAIYIPLNSLNGKLSTLPDGQKDIDWYIKNHFSSEYNYIVDVAGQGWKYGPNIILLLDGYNEISQDFRSAVTRSILDWSSRPGVQILLTSRSGLDFKSQFLSFEIVTLSESTVFQYLKETGHHTIRAHEYLMQILNTPLLLQLYLHTNQEKNRIGTAFSSYISWRHTVSNESDLIWNYLQIELCRCCELKSNTPDSEYGYAILIMAPYLFWRMSQNFKYSISLKEFKAWLRDGNVYLNQTLTGLPEQIDNIIWECGHDLKFDPSSMQRRIKVQFDILTRQSVLFRKQISADSLDMLYFPMHQNFRDAFAALHIYNFCCINLLQSNTNYQNGFPSELIRTNDHFVMRYLANYFTREQLDILWNKNRLYSPTRVPQTYWLLKLLGFQRNNDYSDIDFSNMNLCELSLSDCHKPNSIQLELPRYRSDYFNGSKISDSTFRPIAHSGMINSISLYDNGHYCISASYDHTLRVWDLDSYSCLAVLSGHTDSVCFVHSYLYNHSPYCISASYDGSICVWDLSIIENTDSIITIIPKYILRKHTAGVNFVSVYQDGHRCVSASSDGTLIIWDLDTGRPIGSPLVGHNSPVNTVKVSEWGYRCVSGAANNTIIFWDLENHIPVSVSLSPASDCNQAYYGDPSGHQYIAASSDNSLNIWSLHTYGINDIEIFLHNGTERCIAASSDASLSIWDLNSGMQIQALPRKHSAGINAIKVYDNGHKCVSVSDDKSLIIWDLNHGIPIGKPLRKHSDWVFALDIFKTSRGFICVSSSFDNTLCVWDLDDHSYLGSLAGHSDWIFNLAIFKRGRDIRCISASADASLRIWDLMNFQCIHTINGYSEMILSINAYIYGTEPRCITASSDSVLRIWDLNTYTCIGILEGHTAWVNVVKVYDNGHRCVSGSSDHTLIVWDLDHNSVLHILKGHTDWVLSADVYMWHGIYHCVSASYDNTLRIWDLEKGNQVKNPLIGHASGVRAIKVYDNGKRCISASYDNTLRIWNLLTGQPIGEPLTKHTDWVKDVDVFKCNGHYFGLSASSDKTLVEWDLERKTYLPNPYLGHTAGVKTLKVFCEGRRCISADSTGTIIVWDLVQQKKIYAFKVHSSRINSLDIFRPTNNSTYCICAFDDGFLIILDLDNRRIVKSIHVLHGVAIVGIDLQEAITTSEQTKEWITFNGGQIQRQ